MFFKLTPPCLHPKKEAIQLKNPLFIADIHLKDDDEKGVFASFLNQYASHYTELVILGDFFNYWAGDDALKTIPQLQKTLKNFSIKHPIYFMQGNRDFAVGKDFCKAIGATLINDPTIATVKNRLYLLSHGDIWCTNDTVYQKFRHQTHSEFCQWGLLLLPLGLRIWIAKKIYKKSIRVKKESSNINTDVVEKDILYDVGGENIHAVIHGHTHKPGMYPVNEHLNRYVIPDWRENDNQYVYYGFVALDKNGPRIVEIQK